MKVFMNGPALPKQGKTPKAPKKGLRLAAVTDSARLKREIQALLRVIAIIRDKGCFLRNLRHCGGLPGVPGVVLQYDHLISRSNSATFGDPRLGVCVCKSCHAWKSCGSNLRKAEYDKLVRSILPKDRIALWDMAEADRFRSQKMDWSLVKVVLENQLKKMTTI